MKTISFINLKGGVGKTTVSTNLAYLLAESWELRVLFLDNDKQGNASRWFGANESKGTLANILMDGAKASDVIQHSRVPNIDFIAADMGLLEANFQVLGEQEERQDILLKNALAKVADRYDVCVIDNPPDINMSVFNSLMLTDDVIIVTLPETDSIEGFCKMEEQIRDVKKFHPTLSIRGILVNQYISYPGFSSTLDEAGSVGIPLFKTRIAYATRNAKHALMIASREGKSIFEVCPNCRVARDIMRFTEELLGGA